MIGYKDIGEEDLRDRAAHKQRLRDEDAEALRTGRMTRQEVQRRNSMFTGFDMANARVVWRERKGK